jgi:hypothetical protein
MFSRLPSWLVVIGFSCLAGLIIGCGDSMSSPRPTSSTPVGLTLLSVSPGSGPTVGGDAIRLFGSGFLSGANVTLDGVAAHVTRVTRTVIEARTLAHASGPVDVVVTNPDGQAGTLKAAYTFGEFSVTGGPPVVAPGAELTVSWVSPDGRGCNGGGDWIALYRVGDPDQTGAANGHSDLWYEHVCGAASGTWKLIAPAQLGEYEFRFMVGDFSVARSNSIAVRQ